MYPFMCFLNTFIEFCFSILSPKVIFNYCVWHQPYYQKYTNNEHEEAWCTGTDNSY